METCAHADVSMVRFRLRFAVLMLMQIWADAHIVTSSPFIALIKPSVNR